MPTAQPSANQTGPIAETWRSLCHRLDDIAMVLYVNEYISLFCILLYHLFVLKTIHKNWTTGYQAEILFVNVNL